MRTTGILVAVALALGTSCASTPNLSYYIIDMESSARAEGGVDARVERFVVSERLDRRQIVILSSPVRVEHYATARWAAGVGEMVQTKLAAELGPSGDDPAWVIGGRVTAFEQIDTSSGPRARVAIDVRIREAGAARSDGAEVAKTYEAEVPADGGGAEAAVRALSRALEDVAAEIARDIAAIGA
jgi:uncharacterized lipoprotein YmbA